jgi:cell division septation protein DedD
MPQLATMNSTPAKPKPAVEHAEMSHPAAETSPVTHTASMEYSHPEHTASTEYSHPEHTAQPHHAGPASYRVHVMTSPNEEVADRFASALKARGFNVYVSHTGGGYSIDTGATHNASDATATAAELQKSAYSASIKRTQ